MTKIISVLAAAAVVSPAEAGDCCCITTLSSGIDYSILYRCNDVDDTAEVQEVEGSVATCNFDTGEDTQTMTDFDTTEEGYTCDILSTAGFASHPYVESYCNSETMDELSDMGYSWSCTWSDTTTTDAQNCDVQECAGSTCAIVAQKYDTMEEVDQYLKCECTGCYSSEKDDSSCSWWDCIL